MSAISSPKAHKQIGVAVISNDQGKILIDRRLNQGEMGGLWEFPGGKIEPGETVEQCIEREIKEELDIKIAVGDRLTTITHNYEIPPLLLGPFYSFLMFSQAGKKASQT